MYPLQENNQLNICFGNGNPKTNGEYNLLTNLKSDQIIFDVGCRTDSEFLKYTGEVHYFDPVAEFIQEIIKHDNSNSKSFFNNFGLSSKTDSIIYYPAYQSFHNRIITCGNDDSVNAKKLHVLKGKDYMLRNNIEEIHFLKIDVEGHEQEVLFGFEENIKKIDIIQFEYGGTYKDSNCKLEEIIQFLIKNNFNEIGYLNQYGYVKIVNLVDHYQYCNIVAFNTKKYSVQV